MPQKKKKKRLFTFITSRDVDIFRTLSNGPATSVQIRNDLKNLPATEESSKDKQENEHSRNMSYGALMKRLSILKRGNYINSGLYLNSDRNGMVAYYALTADAIEILATRHGFNASDIRNNLPCRDIIKPVTVDPTITVETFLKEPDNGKYRRRKTARPFDPLAECTEKGDTTLEDKGSLGF